MNDSMVKPQGMAGAKGVTGAGPVLLSAST